MNQQGIDKRRHHRALASLATRVDASGAPSDLQLVTIDISLGGARCAGNHSLEAKSTLRVHFTLEGGELLQPESISTEAVVLRCHENPAALEHRRYEIALQFVRMDSQAKQLLQSYLNSL